jgi:hypothetical protein
MRSCRQFSKQIAASAPLVQKGKLAVSGRCLKHGAFRVPWETALVDNISA